MREKKRGGEGARDSKGGAFWSTRQVWLDRVARFDAPLLNYNGHQFWRVFISRKFVQDTISTLVIVALVCDEHCLPEKRCAPIKLARRGGHFRAGWQQFSMKISRNRGRGGWSAMTIGGLNNVHVKFHISSSRSIDFSRPFVLSIKFKIFYLG